MSIAFVHWTDPSGRLHLAGTLIEVGRVGLQRFEYHPDWVQAGGFELGEGLPVGRGPLLPPGGATEFGLFADAAPDAWGRRVLSRKLVPPPRTATAFLLAAADATRQGALRFSEDADGQNLLSDGGAVPKSTVHDLYREVRDFQADRATGGDFARLLRAGTSQGGFRPKAVVADEAGALWIAKFPSETDTYDVETSEAAALHIAREAGLDVPTFRHLRVDPDRAILLVKRFDRTEGGRVGYQSLRTAARLGPNDAIDYQTAARVSGSLCGTAGRHAVVAAAALNIAIHNIDDHSRNVGFTQRADGAWTPAPLFDVVPYPRVGVGTPLAWGTERTVGQLLELDWGVPAREVAAVVRRVNEQAARLYEVAHDVYGMDPEASEKAERVRSAAARG